MPAHDGEVEVVARPPVNDVHPVDVVIPRANEERVAVVEAVAAPPRSDWRAVLRAVTARGGDVQVGARWCGRGSQH